MSCHFIWCYELFVIQGKGDDLDDDERATVAIDFDVGYAIKEKVKCHFLTIFLLFSFKGFNDLTLFSNMI